jgi:uncharacterized protein YecE (DUF72 family)
MLQYNPEDIDKFLNSVNQPGLLTGCLLIQFPDKITVDYFEQVEGLLQRTTSGNHKSQWHTCVEFRHSSWYNKNTFTMMAKCNAYVVLHDMPSAPISTPVPDAQVVYYRFHGPACIFKPSFIFARKRFAGIQFFSPYF